MKTFVLFHDTDSVSCYIIKLYETFVKSSGSAMTRWQLFTIFPLNFLCVEMGWCDVGKTKKSYISIKETEKIVKCEWCKYHSLVVVSEFYTEQGVEQAQKLSFAISRI